MPESLSVSSLSKPPASVASLCGAESEAFFTRIILTEGDTAGCGHLPFIVWLLITLAPDKLILIGASRSVKETLTQIIHDKILPTRLIETRIFSPLPEAGSVLYYYANPLWQKPDLLKAALNTLPSGSLVLLGDTVAASEAPLTAELEKTFLTFSFFHASGLCLLAKTPLDNRDVNFLITKNTDCPETDLRKKTLLRERFAQAGQFWEKSALLERQAAQIQHLQEELRRSRIMFAENKQKEIIPVPPTDLYQKQILTLAETNATLVQAIAHRPQPEVPTPSFSLIRSLRKAARILLRRAPPPPVSPPPEPGNRLALADLSEQPEPQTTGITARDTASFSHTDHAETSPKRPRRKILFVAGEPDSPGVQYRCIRNAAACVRAGHEAFWKPCADVSPDDLCWADTVVLWRVEFSGHVDILLQLARKNGADIIFDTDDITFLPHMARFDIIDGIRSIGATEQRIEAVFTEMQRTLMRSDLCMAPTDTLAGLMRINKPLTYTVPNTFDAESLRRSRMALRKRHWAGSDGLIRIGYATGSRTHQRDFAQVAGILATLLQERADLRLVLFREPGNHHPVLLMNEFPELTPVADQIEWRDMVALPDLPEETARFDIAIAPLEAGSLFCNAKSELKFFEAALAGVPSVVSPTAPFRQCVTEGMTGFLADTPEEWDSALRTLLASPDLRRHVADNAYHASLWYFGPQRQTLVLDSLLEGLGGGQAAARAAEVQIARGAYRGKGLPDVPPHTVLFHQDRLDEATVTVIITSYNYETFILEALESVRTQTMTVLDLVVVDDGSSDDSVPLITAWMTQHGSRFNRLVLLKTTVNAGLGGARNCAVTHVETPFFLPLDADNRLLPEACTALVAATNEMTAYAYPVLEQFGEPTQHKLLGDKPFHPMQLEAGNYIDAMALVAKWAWAAAGGYYVSRSAMGWEDYDLWCSFAELGLQGTHVPKILAEYRVHHTSMTSSVTEQDAHKQRVVDLVESRHSWIKLVQKAAKAR